MEQVRLRLEAAIRMIRVIWRSTRHVVFEMVVARLSRFLKSQGGKSLKKRPELDRLSDPKISTGRLKRIGYMG